MMNHVHEQNPRAALRKTVPKCAPKSGNQIRALGVTEDTEPPETPVKRLFLDSALQVDLHDEVLDVGVARITVATNDVLVQRSLVRALDSKPKSGGGRGEGK